MPNKNIQAVLSEHWTECVLLLAAGLFTITCALFVHVWRDHILRENDRYDGLVKELRAIDKQVRGNEVSLERFLGGQNVINERVKEQEQINQRQWDAIRQRGIIGR